MNELEWIAAGLGVINVALVVRRSIWNEEAERVVAHLADAGLLRCGAGRIDERIRNDKKPRGGRVPFVVVRGIG